MPGVRLLSHFQIGKETTPGTAVAATRRFAPDLNGTFQIDWMKTFHEGRSTGTRTPISYSTQQGTMVSISYRTPDDTGIAFDELPYFLIFPGGGTAGTGSTAVTWGHAWGGTATGSAVSYTIEYGDDVQNYESEYCQASRVRISAEPQGLTNFEADFVGRQATKSSKTALTLGNPVRIPGYLWKPRFATAQSGLSGASDIPNFLVSWDAEWTTGLTPRFYHDGLAYFGQMVESQPVAGTLHMIVESNATAITQFYDKGSAGTIDFVQMKATGPTLGASNYSAQFQFAVEYETVNPLSSEADGVNLYDITARIVYDSTWGQSVGATVVCSLASL
ncbi:MAG: hypothetical protein RLZ94_1706 [Actinomycetota bacterium]